MLLFLFALAFFVGPALFLALAHRDLPRWPLALMAVLCVTLALVLRNAAGLALDPVPVVLSVMLVWLAWILVMVLVARAVRITYPSPAVRRWTRALCAMATTIPWFGYATAQMMVD